MQVTLPARAREREAALAVAELRPWIERRLAEVRAARGERDLHAVVGVDRHAHAARARRAADGVLELHSQPA